MKKIITGIVCLFTIVFSVTVNAQAPSASGNVMNFPSVASYEPYTEDENTWSSLRAIAEQSSTLTTLAEASVTSVDTLYPEFLLEVLNTDYIFQTGNYLIKIDAMNDRGLVIAAGNVNAYSDLVNNNLTASGMMVLSGDEDFGLDLLEALANNTTNSTDYQSFLNAERECKGAKRRVQKKDENWYSQPNSACEELQELQFFMDNKAVYQKFIFYFSLQSKIHSKQMCSPKRWYQSVTTNDFVDIKLAGNVKFRVRCGPESNINAELYESYYAAGNGVLHWRPFSGGRSLSHYDFNVDFGIRQAQDRNPNPPPYIPSEHYRIMWGY
ncbi:MAG: hypothetical protein ACT4OJ_09270 [Bacteroidota bacterium]